MKHDRWNVNVPSKSVKQEQRSKARMDTEPALVPLSDDGPKAKEKLAEIQSFMIAAGPDGYRDKIALWRKELRAARYADWLARG